MDYRSFEGVDDATEHNLRVLEHRSQQEPYGEAEDMQQMLMHVIGTHGLLPKPLRALIPISRCYTGDGHYRMSSERRQQLWRDINSDLREGLDRVIAEQACVAVDPSGLADRPETQGERILALCEKLKFAGWDIELAQQLQRVGAETEVAGKARQLEALFRRRNFPDVDAHEREISDLTARIKMTAQRLHHRRGLV
ncbi:hypothetical protein ACN9MB_13580 [Dyella kyungheensis]|uniref:hypothetical protein n=1 Tax=Dyella kyungheensis TaxID=1242174 RepID=UPI003CF9E9B8